MNRIAVLPPEISQKIAAGEVIERPASVVKELVENSLDAAATEIRVELQEGGKRLVRVQDNGWGMSREDARIAFERHSTSKISREEDLSAIRTLGFRGEALASISSVSRLTLRTWDGEEAQGTLVERGGGQLVRVSDDAFPKGTRIDVEDLFFNLPARKKFLRSDRSELTLIAKYVTNAALAYPGVRFILVHGKREIISCPEVGTLRERVYALFGKTFLDRLAEVDGWDGNARVSGFASRPLAGHPDKSHQYFFVNKRPVRDRVLQAALNQSYRGFLEKNMSPEAILFLSLPFEDIDVNVHPSKTEVRFKDSPFVFQLLLKAVGNLLLGTRMIKDVYPEAAGERRKRGVAETGEMPPLPLGAPPAAPAVTRPAQSFYFEASGKAEQAAGLQVFGQYLQMYIIAGREDALLVIDQHNAHERVLYEKFKEIGRGKDWPRRMPLIPLLVELSPSQEPALEENGTLLEEAGFRAESMGGRTVALREFPDIFKDGEAAAVFLSLLEEMKEGGVEERRERLLATMACKAAVKAGESIPREKMAFLVEELFKTSQPSLCPHGRPVIVKVDRSEIEKGLRRA